MYYNQNRKPSIGKVTSAVPSLADIDWSNAANIYSIAADEAAEMANESFRGNIDRQHKAKMLYLEDQWEQENPESGSYEGNMSDEHPSPSYGETPGIQEIRRSAGQRALSEKFLAHFNKGAFIPKVLPELINLVGSFQITRNNKGLISAIQFCRDHFVTSERQGMHRLLTLNSKSSFMDKQYTGDARNYCALVPSILYAIRKAKNIKYSEWDPEEIDMVVHSKLVDAMLWDKESPDSVERLRDREPALTFKTGTKAGTVRSPVTTHKLYGTLGTCYEGMPEYVGVMAAQIWCAHPDNRTKYMILDPLNWDAVPMPLVSMSVTLTKPIKQNNTPKDLSWM